MLPPEQKNLKHNYIVNLLDGGFFGFGMGITSFATMLPLFVSTMTDSAILIGLIPAIHNVGWQLPQLLSARKIASLPLLKPLVLRNTIQERLPFFALAFVAWFFAFKYPPLGLVLTYLIFIWQGLGAGITANAWQNMIGKIIPDDYRATFFGAQSSAANLLASGGAVISGFLLQTLPSPLDFTLCFLITSGLMAVSWFFLRLTKEEPHPIPELDPEQPGLWKSATVILKKDTAFVWFLIARTVSQIGMMSFAFYTVYAVKYLHMSEVRAGILTSVLMITQVVANPVLGWLADHWSRRGVLLMGTFCTLGSALIAWIAPDLTWFYPVMILTAVGNVSFWTIGMAVTLQFGREDERPMYVGLANTLMAPAAILAPLFGGWLADAVGYSATFFASVVACGITAVIIYIFIKDRPKLKSVQLPLAQV